MVIYTKQCRIQGQDSVIVHPRKYNYISFIICLVALQTIAINTKTCHLVVLADDTDNEAVIIITSYLSIYC